MLSNKKIPKHDDQYRPMVAGDGPSDTPDEHFFIERLGTSLNKTGKLLREEEERVFTTERWSRDDRELNCHYRDYYQLCRGLTLVCKIDF